MRNALPEDRQKAFTQRGNAKVFGEGFADRCLAGAHVSYDDD